VRILGVSGTVGNLCDRKELNNSPRHAFQTDRNERTGRGSRRISDGTMRDSQMTTRRMFFATIAGVAALATGGLATVTHAAPAPAAPAPAAPVEMQSEQSPRGRVMRRRSRGAYRRDWRNRRMRRRYWRRRAWRRGW
jgi:hypothetical protein